jgi:spermidine synthase
MKFSLFHVIQSYLTGRIIEKVSSPINPILEIRLVNNRLVLDAAHANYSFGSLHRVFRKAFLAMDIEKRKISQVLILGFGAGSVASILLDEYKMNCHITGVEIDDEVIRLAEKYFNKGRLLKVEIIKEDAAEFVLHQHKNFDLIIVDIYLDQFVPDQFEAPEFLEALKRLLVPGGVMVFNKMIGDEKSRKSAVELVDRIKGSFDDVNVLLVREKIENWMIVAQVNN